MGSQSSGNVVETYINIDVLIPQSLSNGCSSQIHLLIKIKLGDLLTPHASLPTNHIHSGNGWIIFTVQGTPSNEDLVRITIASTCSHVQVGSVIIGENHLIGTTDQIVLIGSHTPPVNDIFRLKWQIDILIGPVNNLFVGVGSKHFLLLFPIPHCECLTISNTIILHKLNNLRHIIPTFKCHLIPSKMNVTVREGIIYKFHHIIHHLPSQV